MNIKLLSLCIASAISGTASAEIFISQYVEGGGYNKAIEIANTGDSEVDLADYKLAISKDGGQDWDEANKFSFKKNTLLGSKEVYVVSSTDTKRYKVDAKITAQSDERDEFFSKFNGDDPIALLKDGKLHDVIGVMGDKDWGKDKTLTRNSNGQAASTTYNLKHWKVLNKNDFSGLGQLDIPDAPAEFNCKTDANEDPTFTPIGDIQGEGGRSPLLTDGNFITPDPKKYIDVSKADFYVKGVVTAVTTGSTKGFYLQAETPDSKSKTSDGLFISTNEGVSKLKPGDVVCVKGKVSENYGVTELKSDANSYKKMGTINVPIATKLVVNKGETLRGALERHEGMLIELDADSDIFVSAPISSYRSEMVLSHKKPLIKPTQKFAAETPQATALANENKNRRAVLQFDKAPKGKVPYYPNFAKDDDQNESSEHHIRLGSRVEGVQAVVHYSYGQYRLITTNNQARFIDLGTNSDGEAFDVARKAAPSITDSDLRIASFNVLNYFNTTDSGSDNPKNENRGAEKLDEFLVQKAKIVKAITQIDADIVGLMEIENNGFTDRSAIHHLTEALNAELPNAADHYSYVVIADGDKYQGEFLGSDSITVAMLYRASKVTPKQAARVIETPEQYVAKGAITVSNGKKNSEAIKKGQRHSLLQTFTVKQTSDDLSIVVNHFKSKGSGCAEDSIKKPTDLQGSCNRFRVSAAKVIGEALKNIKGDVLVMGDLNAYGLEDPVLVLTDYDSVKKNYGRPTIMTASYTTLGKESDGTTDKVYEQTGSKIDKGYGYINLNTALHGTDTYSYTWDGEQGNLDHALANDSLANKVVAIEDWHINSAESNMFEYGKEETGDMPKYKDVYSSSDHDPVIIAIDLPEPRMELPTADSGEQLSVDVTLPLSTKVGDTVTVSFTESVASRAAQPAAKTYTASAKVTQADLDKRMIAVKFDKMPQAGKYKVEQKLKDKSGKETMIYRGDVTVQPSSSTSSTPASTTTKIGGGSFGFGAMLSLFGLAAWRRRKQA